MSTTSVERFLIINLHKCKLNSSSRKQIAFAVSNRKLKTVIRTYFIIAMYELINQKDSHKKNLIYTVQSVLSKHLRDNQYLLA